MIDRRAGPNKDQGNQFVPSDEAAPPARPKILATYPMPARVVEKLRSFADLTVLDGETDPQRVLDRCLGMDALICTLMTKVSADFVARLPESVRILATYSVGYDHVDLKAVGARGLPFINTPDVLTEATADIAWLLLLGAARRGWEAQSMLREGRWIGWEPTQLVGADVYGKTLGVLGFGRIGRAVARRAAGFGMKVLTFQRRPGSGEPLPDHVELRGSLDEVLAESDFVSLHLPLSEQTSGWLNAARIATMRRGAIVVNTARGGLIDEAALADALGSGQIGAAGLDVFVGEPNVSETILAAPNTYLLPHVGSATSSARDGMGLSLASDLEAFFAGRPMVSQVDTAA